ncbi:hypothetical protein [Ferruginibacter sp.]|nr:hypothetical protein [Ferruginibacter sp.]
MHHLIASYLFQNKTCPLPGLGTLSIAAGKAESDFLNTAIKAPVPAIVFETKEHDASNLLDYIAAKNNNTVFQAIEMLGQFCNNLKAAVITDNKAVLNGVGTFSADASGNIYLRQDALPQFFVQPVKAERVIHPQAEHNILVGDKETTNTIMTEYFNEEPVQKSRWWIWAIVLGTIGLLAIVFYLSNTNLPLIGANATSIF